MQGQNVGSAGDRPWPRPHSGANYVNEQHGKPREDPGGAGAAPGPEYSSPQHLAWLAEQDAQEGTMADRIERLYADYADRQQQPPTEQQ